MLPEIGFLIHGRSQLLIYVTSIRFKLMKFTQTLFVSVNSLFCMKITASVKKALIKIMVCAMYTYLFLLFTYTHLFCSKIKSWQGCCFHQQITPQTTVQLYILQDYSSVRIGLSMNNKRHTLQYTPCQFKQFTFRLFLQIKYVKVMFES